MLTIQNTIYDKIVKDKNQIYNTKNYNKFIKNMDIHALTCSCAMSGQLINRHIKIPNSIII